MQRHKIFKSHRIKVTEKIIKNCYASCVLEIGSGDYSFKYLTRPNSRWQKVDFAPPCDSICDLNRENVLLPYNNHEFDLVICTQVLEHLLWPHSLLLEMARVLMPMGRILISVPNCVSLTYRLAWMSGRLPSCAATANLPLEIGSTAYLKNDGGLVGGHVIDFNLRRTIDLVLWAGFEISSIKGAGIIWHKQLLPHWLVPVSLSSNIICLAKKIS